MKLQATLTAKLGIDPTAFAPYFVEEERHVWADYETGFLREMYFQPDPITVTLIFEATDPSAVTARLGTYPMVAAGLLDVRVVQLGPWVPLKALFRPDVLT
jgi:hypothetical protein